MGQEPLNELSARQRELLELVRSGITASKDIARLTGLSPSTIDNNLSIAARKLAVRDRVAAAEKYEKLVRKSTDPSPGRNFSFSEWRKSAVSWCASTFQRLLSLITEFFRGPPLGGKRHRHRWPQIVTQILQTAAIGMVTTLVLLLFVLGFYPGVRLNTTEA